MSSDSYEVHEPLADHHYRTEIPNIVFELGLDIYSFQLYIHLKKIAGDYGYSSRSVSSLSKYCNMSDSKIKESMKILQCTFDKIGNSLITVVARFKEDGSPNSNIVTINPIWRNNGDYFRSKKKSSVEGGGGLPQNGGVGCHKTGGGLPQNHKEEPFKEDPIKKELLLGNEVPAREESAKNNKQDFLVISDVHAYCIRCKLNWSIEEIEESFSALKLCKLPLSDPYEYISGIIRNKRNIAKLRRQKEIAKASRPKSKPLREEASKPKEPPPSQDESWEKDPTSNPLWGYFKPWEQKRLIEESLQRINKQENLC